MIQEANNLVTLKQQVESKRQVLNDFHRHFFLTDHELSVLTSSADPVSEDFFQALVKARKINTDCRVLLGGESQRLGLEIVDRSSKQLDSAFQRLFRWIQREFKSLDLENPSMNFTMRRALRVLAERPTLFQSCLDTFAEVRERSLSDGFYAALTGSNTAGGMQKPIEFSAHEPLRYVGDMLAWAHSTAVSERESLEVLFISEGNEIAKSIEAGLESEPWSRPESGEVFDGKRALLQLVNRNLNGVAQLLRSRIVDVIRTHAEPATAYKIANVVVFYRDIFKKLIEEGDFLRTLSDLEASAQQQFDTNMASQLERVTAEEMGVPDQHDSPDFFVEALDQLKELLRSYDTSVSSADNDRKELSSLFERALDPFLERLDGLADTLKMPVASCFLLNCWFAARSTLTVHTFTKSKVEQLNGKSRERIEGLVDHQHASLLEKSGIQALVDALSELPSPAESPDALFSHKAFSKSSIMAAREKLDDFLPSALLDAQADLDDMKNTNLAHEITAKAAEQFCDDFEKLDEAIVAADEYQRKQLDTSDADEEPETIRVLFPRTREEIGILLS